MRMDQFLLLLRSVKFKRNAQNTFLQVHRINVNLNLNKEQLNEIKTSSMARILCDNTDVTQIQPNAFLLPLPSLKYLILFIWSIFKSI